MIRLSIPDAPDLETTVYNNFRGVDFSKDPALVDETRSPYAVNVISDYQSGTITKRLGFRTIGEFGDKINGIFCGEISGEDVYLVHAGDTLYKFYPETSEKEEIKTGISDEKSTVFFMDYSGESTAFILTGQEYLYYDGETVGDVTDIATVPKVIISRDPTGGGVLYEAVNLIQPKRKDSFLGDSTSLVYQLSATEIDENSVSVEVANDDGGYDTLTSGYSVNYTSGKVTFTLAKPPVITGSDNVIITYSKEIEGYKERVTSCSIATLYGLGSSNRVFLSGNGDYKSYDWYSQIYDPTYFADTNYAVIGSQDAAIMGYQKIGEYLAIIKEENQQDTTIYLRYASYDDDDAVFKVVQGVAGVGAIARGSFATLRDEPLFLSKNGICATTTSIYTNEKTAINRSLYVDKKLAAEIGRDEAVACEWNNYYILAVNERCYILDGRTLTTDSTGQSTGVYDCYYWEGVPAICWLSTDNILYYGTSDGRVCRINNDYCYDDGTYMATAYNDDGNAIEFIWSTKRDDDDAAYMYKTLNKKGCQVTMTPYDTSSASVYFSVDGYDDYFITNGTANTFDWRLIDFDQISFSSADAPTDIALSEKVKKYKRLQIIIKNDVVNQPCGIQQISKTYSYGNYTK